MSSMLYVSNLPLWVTDSHLQERFSRFGEVKYVEVLREDVSRKSSGFGVVQMEDVAGAQKAINWLNLSNYDGQLMSVSFFEGQAHRTHKLSGRGDA